MNSKASGVSDPRTGRPFGDHGTAADVVEWLLNEMLAPLGTEMDTFLHAWSQGDLDEWPEFYEWLAEREATLSPPLPSLEVERLVQALILMEHTFGRSEGYHYTKEQIAAVGAARGALGQWFSVKPATEPCARLDPQGSALSALPLDGG